MANRNRINTVGAARNTPGTTDQLSLPSSSNPKINEKNDDLIVSLSDAYENRRARQVGEWERLYSNNVYRAV